ncbi:S66 peptidase family protein [Actinopolyspora mortivallis]|uniref:S66 peptidase family protein n=1 Tax=Actinopolyspora mortivallis TaxID=33906 RepID=UPI00035DE560|nr:LD-carboxypeptidase [Actinopolyspora mortivallis]
MTNSTAPLAPLRPGDTVAVVAPAGPVPEQQLRAGVVELESWGLRVLLGKHVLDRHPSVDYLAGSDTARAADLLWAWCSPEISAVFCARGGYGTLRTLDELDWTSMAAVPGKTLVGSSDVTALHEALYRRLGVPTLFGPMPATSAFTEDPVARRHLHEALFHPVEGRVLTGSTAEPLVGGRARGVLHGGNLSVLAGTLGTIPPPRPPERALVLLEDVTEEPYQLDRYLTQLRRSGWFGHATGVVLGSWERCGDPERVRQTMSEILGDLGVPVVWELGFGHCAGQLTVPLGLPAELDADAGRLVIHTSPSPARG